MTDYISRDAAVKIAEKYGLANGSVLGRHTGLADCIASEISALPAADVAEVVRCKDCSHAYINSFAEKSGVVLCSHWTNMAKGNAVITQFDDFCSYGKPKKGK